MVLVATDLHYIRKQSHRRLEVLHKKMLANELMRIVDTDRPLRKQRSCAIRLIRRTVRRLEGLAPKKL